MAVVFFHFVSKGYGLLVEKIWSAERYGPPKWVYNHNLWTVVGYLMMSGCCIVNIQCFIPLVLHVATSPFTSQFRSVRSQLRLFQLSQLSPLAMQHRKFALQLVSFASRLRLLTSQLRLFAPSPFLLLEAYFISNQTQVIRTTLSPRKRIQWVSQFAVSSQVNFWILIYKNVTWEHPIILLSKIKSFLYLTSQGTCVKLENQHHHIAL